MFKRYKLRDYDFKLILMTIALAAIGVVAIGSAEQSLQSKQLFGVIAGVVVMIALSFINYNSLLRLYWLMYAGNIALLLLVMLVGEDHKGAQRWLQLGPITFQPSETAKILLILFFAQYIMKYKEKLNTAKVILSCVVLVGIPWLLIFLQPDLSTSIMIMVIFCVIMFSGGLSYKIILGILAVAIPVVAITLSIVLQVGS